MRYPRSTATAAVLSVLAAFPAFAQTNGTSAPPPTTQQPGAGQMPDMNGQAGGPMREMIRQMVDQAVKEKMDRDRSSEKVDNRQEDENARNDTDRPVGRWQRHRFGGPAGEQEMAGHHGPRMMRGAGMRLMFAFLDVNGDGSLSENEVQDAVGRIFSAIDQNGDEKIDMDEIQSFLHGSGDVDMP
ncbi:MAG: EF-hand domain-containing protein [Mesorhizobium sp.]|nr:MAG: EF-hand domain-containing protein [Mesorhizobium sp.]TIP51442.1 MAG: EF-hand domain-containing protein [Mesorhizobium sp.]